MLAQIADRLVLRPSRDTLEAEGKTRRVVKYDGGRLELWLHCAGDSEDRKADLWVLKLPGSAGRAERATEHPADHWTDLRVDVWTMNPPGYGGSSGRASMRSAAAAAEAVLAEMRPLAGEKPILVFGNSFGAASALRLAASQQVDGLLLRNPPPLRQVFVSRARWWNLWFGPKFLSRYVPEELDSIRNASRVTAPAVFLTSGKDRMVPPDCQRQVIEAYAGEKQILNMPEADHATPLEEDEEAHYLRLLDWLRQRATTERCA
jgi:pimeloyl-ACP methyl ester carboxylesterase